MVVTASNRGSKGRIVTHVLFLLIALSVFWGGLLAALGVIESLERDKVRNSLTTVRDSVHSSLTHWAEDQRESVAELAGHPEVVSRVQELLSLGEDRTDLLRSPSQDHLRGLLSPLLKLEGIQDYIVVAPDGVSIASSRDATVGTGNPMHDQADVMRRLWGCLAAVGRPMRSDVPLPDADGVLRPMMPTMFAGACIRDDAGQAIGVLLLRIDPFRRLYDLLRRVRLGQSGESYIFDVHGRLLSPTRADFETSESGSAVAAEFLGRSLREPGSAGSAGQAGQGDPVEEPPLTLAVERATFGESGSEVEGYLGYRDVPVIGAWLWDGELGVGLVTEIEREEAYQSFATTRWLGYSGTLFATVLIFLLIWVMRRAQRGIDTLELEWRRVFDASVDGVIVIDSKGVMKKVNPATCELFGYEDRELLGWNVSKLMAEPHRSQHDGYLWNYLHGGNPEVIGARREVLGLRKDGTSFPFDLSVSVLVVNGKHHFAGFIHDLTRHKEMEEELAAERQLNADTLDGLAESIAVLDERGEIVFVNKVWREFALENGWEDPQAGLGMNYLKVTLAAGDDDVARNIGSKLTALLAGEISEFRARYPCHSPGVERWFLLRANRFVHLGATRIAISHQDISARVFAEEKLRAANDRLRTMARVAEGTHNAVIVTDPLGRITWVNQGFTDLSGYSEREVLNRKPGEFLQGPDTSDRARKRLRQAVRWAVPIELDILNYNKDQTPYWVRLAVSPVRDEKGEVVQFVSIGQDITAQRELVAELNVAKEIAEDTAEKLRKNQEILNLALEGGGAGYWHYDPVNDAVFWDVQSSKTYGMAPEAFRGHFEDWVRCVHPDDIEEVNRDFQAKLQDASAARLDMEYRILRRDGDVGYIQVNGGIDRDDQGAAIAVYGLHFDLTERWLNQQKLLSATRSLESLNRDLGVTMKAMGEVGLALFWLDAESGAISKASEFACRRLGFSEEELLERRWRDICPSFVGDVFAARVAQIRERGFGRFEMDLATSGGEQFPAEVLSFYRAGDTRHPATLITFVTDITERKNIEADLIISREAAESASRAKSAFLATMSHEIRTPINGVVGMSELLEETRLDGDQRSMLRSMRTSALALRTIIDDILDFSKIEAGKLELAPTVFSPVDLMEEVAQTLAPLAAGKHIHMVLDVDPGMGDCFVADPVRIRQILFNLGSNAIKFIPSDSPRGRVILECRHVKEVGEGAQVEFAVTDNGVGIAPEARSRLFNPFTQVEADTNRRFGGTGLGLAISMQLAKLMGGAIDLESESGEGSRFSLRLTVQRADCDSESLLGEWDFSDTRIYLVGMDAELSESMARLLDAYSAQVAICSLGDAPALIEEAEGEQQAFAVVLGDDPSDTSVASLLRAVTNPRRCILLQPRNSFSDSRAGGLKLRSAPVLPSELLRSVAVALGKADPDISETHSGEPAPQREVPTVEQAESDGRLVLVAEDNEINRDVLARQLRLLGYAYLSAADGEAALALWRQHRFGLVLTDCHMPEMDGYALTAAIRADEADGARRVPIIAVTANALKGEAEHCLAEGMDDYLTKPLELHALRRLLGRWLPLEASVIDPERKVEPNREALAPSSGGGTEHVAAGSEVVAPDVLAALVGDDPAVIRSFLKRFVPTAREMAADIERAVAGRDAEGVRSGSHKLKGSARAVGAMPLGDLCAALERAARESAWPEIERLQGEFQSMLQAVVDYIDKV